MYSGCAGFLEHADSSCTHWGPMMSLGGRLTPRAIFIRFISQLLNDKIKFGSELGHCTPIFDMIKLWKWYKRWCPLSFEPTREALLKSLKLHGKLPLKEVFLFRKAIKNKNPVKK